MLDRKRLSAIPLLIQNGWTPAHRTDVVMRYQLLEQTDKEWRVNHGKKQSIKQSREQPCGQQSNLKRVCQVQVPITELFQTAEDIVEALDGIRIRNPHAELGLGENCNAIEFNFFEYDASSYPELLDIQSKIGKRVLFIGIGYDIIGDWLADENGAIYFRDKIRNKLHLVSENIYQFLERDIYTLTDRNGKSILSEHINA